jgi:hypothetical protein
MAASKKEFCNAFKLFKKGNFAICVLCINFFKSGSKCICTGDIKEHKHAIPFDDMIFEPITNILKTVKISKKRSKKPCQKKGN